MPLRTHMLGNTALGTLQEDPRAAAAAGEHTNPCYFFFVFSFNFYVSFALFFWIITQELFLSLASFSISCCVFFIKSNFFTRTKHNHNLNINILVCKNAGQSSLMALYELLFANKQISCAQVLLTDADFSE